MEAELKVYGIGIRPGTWSRCPPLPKAPGTYTVAMEHPMITTEALRRLASMQGVPTDAEPVFTMPCAVTDWAHELKIIRGAVLARHRFTDTPTLGEIAKAMAALLLENEWLR